jgi:GGDEF domain-containing protein
MTQAIAFRHATGRRTMTEFQSLLQSMVRYEIAMRLDGSELVVSAPQAPDEATVNQIRKYKLQLSQLLTATRVDHSNQAIH